KRGRRDDHEPAAEKTSDGANCGTGTAAGAAGAAFGPSEVGDGDEGASARGARAGRDGATAARGGGAAAGGRGKAGKRDDRVGGVAAATRPSEGGIAAAEEHDRDTRGRPRTAAPGKGRPGPAGGEVAQGPRTGADGGPGGDGTAEAARRLPGARERAV